MATRFAYSARTAASIMLQYGLSLAQVQSGLNALEQASLGYYYADDVDEYIESVVGELAS